MRVALVFLVLLAGCGGADSPSRCMDAVQRAFPQGDVRMSPENKFHYIVRDVDGSVWWVETGNFSNPDISEKVRVFPATEKSPK